MLQARKDPAGQTVSEITNQIKEMVKNEIDLLEVASKLFVKPGTVSKIISGRPLSLYIKIKIRSILKHDKELAHPSPQSPVQELLALNRLYQETGTLQAVGERVGLCRERVRQLLSKGDRIGLFTYQPKKLPLISRKKILSDYRKYLNLSQVAKANDISIPYLAKLRALHKIEWKDLHPMRKAEQRRECILAYASLREHLGHYPTTTELQNLKKGRYLERKIQRLWGSFRAFQETIHPSRSSLRSCV